MPRFTVDTHLFRELGELLVGRDSTALVELIKNSYDADATEVTVSGENLDNPKRGRIVIKDNGNGMTVDTFETGFLRIASRLKETGDRRSPIYKRRYTGAKGVGRLAAQKLAWNLSVFSVPNAEVLDENTDAVRASINWSKIDQCQTLDDEGIGGAITVKAEQSDDPPGTEIELTKLRGKWTPGERSRVIREVTTFQAPEVLLVIPRGICTEKLLFKDIRVRDVSNANSDPGFTLHLKGDLDVGEQYWSVVAQAADWILEIEADHKTSSAEFLITPTKAFLEQFPDATDGHSADPDLVLQALESRGCTRLEKTLVSRPVATLDSTLAREKEYSSRDDVVPLFLDDWPTYAEPAYARVETIGDNPNMRMYVKGGGE